ncbi:hypothetical protein T484DRAFT_1817144 [Baffinella frigidus]|nr:hypothetical protein T484DRAFT_1817144 [Cryptophyta sp. CCMP2293]
MVVPSRSRTSVIDFRISTEGIESKLLTLAGVRFWKGRTPVIDFRISTEGIESKLLTLAVMIDHVDLHNSRYKSMQEVNEQRQAMESSDSELLGILSDASGDLLQDDACVNQLSKAKSNFKAAAERLLAAEEEEAFEAAAERLLAAEEEEARSLELFEEYRAARSLELFEEYRAVAARGALLFEASTVMAEVNPIYAASTVMAEVNPIYAVSRLIFDQLFEQIIRSISTPGSLMPLHMSDWRRSEMVEAVTNMTMRHLSLGYLSKDHHLFQLLAAGASSMLVPP